MNKNKNMKIVSRSVKKYKKKRQLDDVSLVEFTKVCNFLRKMVLRAPNF